jgi:hypothetical protein
MGFHVTFASDGYFLDPAPEWLREKWSGVVSFSGSRFYCVCAMTAWHSFEIDLLAAIRQSDRKTTFCLTYLYECGNVDRSFISEAGIVHAEPIGWKRVKSLRSHQPWDECVPMMKHFESVATTDCDLEHVRYPQSDATP